MSFQRIHIMFTVVVLAIATVAIADDDPRHERHEAMEEVGDAAKPLGEMLKGEREYDADVLMASLNVFKEVSMQFGDWFPPGTETGMGTEAAPAIWSDRAGFEDALAQWRDAVTAAIDASPGTVDDAKPVLGEVFNACKNCHDTYRIEDE